MMRIRTLKPEFWSHPLIGRLPGDVQALAIGLLNMADDEGYLLADASNVRSALRPFDDESSNVRRALDELARIGWVILRKHASHGLIGRIPNFCAHQRIDRPKTSKLKKYYDVAIDDESTTNRRALDDETAGEGKGTGNREQGRELTKGGAQKRLRALPWNDEELEARASIEAIFFEVRGMPLPWTKTQDSAPFREKLKTYGLARLEKYWRFALRTDDRYLRVSTIAALCGKNFSRIADAAEGTAPGPDITKGVAPVGDFSHLKEGESRILENF